MMWLYQVVAVMIVEGIFDGPVVCVVTEWPKLSFFFVLPRTTPAKAVGNEQLPRCSCMFTYLEAQSLKQRIIRTSEKQMPYEKDRKRREEED
jgi:hypothetical protein